MTVVEQPVGRQDLPVEVIQVLGVDLEREEVKDQSRNGDTKYKPWDICMASLDRCG